MALLQSTFPGTGVGPLCVRIPLNPQPKCIVCFSIRPRNPQYCIKLHMIPSFTVPCHYQIRAYAETESPVPDGVNLANCLNPRLQSPENIQRSESLLDYSNNSLNNLNDFEKPLQELFDEVKTLIATGKRSDAIHLLQANYEAVKERLDDGCSSMEEAAILDVIALGYVAVGDFKLVESILKLLNEVVNDLDDGEIVLDSVLIHMGSMYSALGKFEKSMLMYRRALKILECLYGDNSIFLVTPLLGLAKVLSSNGKAARALENYQRAITILELSRGIKAPDLLLPLSSIGNLLIREGKAKDAEIPFARILSIYTEIYGETDGRVGMALCSLAHVKCAQGNADEAIGLYRKALQIIKDSNYMALDDSTTEKMRIDLAELLHVVGREDEGRELLEECLMIAEKYKGKDHPGLATHLINLATSYSYSKNFGDAERLLRMSLRVIMKTVGPDDPSITFPMLHLAIALYNLNRDKEAESLVLKVLRAREAAFGEKSLPVGEALDCLVSIQTRLGEADDKLLETLKRVLEIQEKGFGHESVEVMLTLKKIIFYLGKLGRKDEKLPLERRLSLLRKKFEQRIP
ncbi:hypothetical protein Nepgr_031465 [Nepenthes gracilis]|uniref:Nephrocystin-3 n=1 Tax=Nepenthes gracilis TaxID=150966 RepID=A0AAD3Y4U7_NEPGR|nr:hypothetical protein Nepgr_031465 [Nepenthes gracilis]